MGDKAEKFSEQQGLSLDLGKAVQSYFDPLVNLWQDFLDQTGSQESSILKGRYAELLRSNLKMSKTLLTALPGPAELNNFKNVTEITPDFILITSQSFLRSISEMQNQAGEWIRKRSESLSEADIQELDSELLNSWRNIYEDEFSKYFKLPQIGPYRFYQERSLNLVDKLNSFQLQLCEFLHMLYMPVEKSLTTLQDEMIQMADSGKIDDNPRTYYNLWIKSMEGHYMELFKQEDYCDVLHRTLIALNNFSEAKNELMDDHLKQLNIPSNNDFDELSKEIYFLKKRIRALERKNNNKPS